MVINLEDDSEGIKLRMPRHIAFALTKTTEEAFQQALLVVEEVIKQCVSLNIPIMTFYLIDQRSTARISPQTFEAIAEFLSSLAEDTQDTLIKKHSVKISVLGKWYNLPSPMVDAIKQSMEKTMEYSTFFVNFCMNYDGQDEIVDAFKLIGKQIQAEKLDPETLTKDMVKENLASSYFPPPELIVVSGEQRKTHGLLLWDSGNATLYSADKPWLNFNREDLIRAINEYRKNSTDTFI